MGAQAFLRCRPAMPDFAGSLTIQGHADRSVILWLNWEKLLPDSQAKRNEIVFAGSLQRNDGCSEGDGSKDSLTGFIVRTSSRVFGR